METLTTVLNTGLVILAGMSFIWRSFKSNRKAPAVTGLFALLLGAGYWIAGLEAVAQTLFYVGVSIWVCLTLLEDIAEWRAKKSTK